MALLFLFIVVCFVGYSRAAEEEELKTEPVQGIAPPDEGKDASHNNHVEKHFDLDLGPIVFNEHGQMGRLQNWKDLTPHERVKILKVTREWKESKKIVSDVEKRS
jgi:hypothetical protein